MFIEFEVNRDRLPQISDSIPTVLLGGGALVLSSELEGNLNIGDYTCVNRSSLSQGVGTGTFSYIADANVGRYSMIGSRVSIGGFEHPKNWLSVAAFQWGQSIDHWDISEKSTIAIRKHIKPNTSITSIGPDSWIGNNATVLSGRSVGIGAIVGAGSVVTKDVENFPIVVGNPSRKIGYRFDERTRNFLTKSKWWELDFDQLSVIDFSNISNAIRQLIELGRGSD